MVCSLKFAAFLLYFRHFLTYPVSIQLNQNVNGFIGSNGSKLVCTFTLSNSDTFQTLRFKANGISIVIIQPHDVSLTSSGSYLEGRVDLSILQTVYFNATHTTSAATFIFTDLLCIDDNIYKCELNYLNKSNDYASTSKDSEASNVTVKVKPKKPSYITVFRKLDNLQISTTESSTTNPASSNHSLSILSHSDDISREAVFIEGTSIVIFCSGEIGNPPDNLTFQKIQKDGSVGNLIPVNEEVILRTENCSYQQNSSYTMNLTSEDNGLSFRCAVTSSIHVDGMYIETNSIGVQFQVRIPVIMVYQSKHNELPITLSCRSRGNPEPEYAWFKATNVNITDMWESYANVSQNITLTNKTDMGVYRCDVSNVIGKDVFRQSTTKNITFEERTTPSTTDPSEPVNTTKRKLDGNNILNVGVGVSVSVVVVIVVVLTIGICRKKSQATKSPSPDELDDTLVHQQSTRQTLDADNYSSVFLDHERNSQESDAKNIRSLKEETRKHNEKYLKQHEEKYGRNDAQDSQQSVEYAVVNKPNKSGSSQPLEDTNPSTEYAEVNILQNGPPDKQPNDEDQYASGREIYDHAHDRRHKKPTESNPHYTSTNKNRRSDKVGSIVGEPIKQKQVAKVKPSGRADYENAGIELDDVIKKKEDPNTAL